MIRKRISPKFKALAILASVSWGGGMYLASVTLPKIMDKPGSSEQTVDVPLAPEAIIVPEVSANDSLKPLTIDDFKPEMRDPTGTGVPVRSVNTVTVSANGDIITRQDPMTMSHADIEALRNVMPARKQMLSVVATTLNLRNEPNDKAAVEAKITQDSCVTQVNVAQGPYIKVLATGADGAVKTGFVHRDYVTQTPALAKCVASFKPN